MLSVLLEQKIDFNFGSGMRANLGKTSFLVLRNEIRSFSRDAISSSKAHSVPSRLSSFIADTRSTCSEMSLGKLSLSWFKILITGITKFSSTKFERGQGVKCVIFDPKPRQILVYNYY